MKKHKKWLSGLVLAVFLLSVVNLPVFAEDGQNVAAPAREREQQVFETESGAESSTAQALQMKTAAGAKEAATVEITGDWLDLGPVETAALDWGFFDVDGADILKDGAYANFIDRVNLPDYALDFYNLLVHAVDNDGVNDYLIDDVYFSATDGKAIELNYSNGTSDIFNGIFITKVETGNTAISEEEKNEVIRNIYTAFSAFDRDHPEVFWLTGTVSLSMPTTTVRYSDGTTANMTSFYLVTKEHQTWNGSADLADLRTADYQSAAAIQTGIVQRDTQVQEILAGIASGASVYDTVRYLNDWLAKNNEYNSDLENGAANCWECISALVGREGTEGPVCEGYARAMKVLCDAAAIPCVLVSGHAQASAEDSGEGHMWNYVQLEDAWYGVDVTWNDPRVQNPDGSYVTGKVSGHETEEYLLVGAETVNSYGLPFSQSHPVENKVHGTSPAFTNGPELNSTAYEAAVADELEVSVDRIEMGAKGGEATVAVTCNGEWTAKEIVDGGLHFGTGGKLITATGDIMFDKTEGTGDGQFTITIGKNSSDASKTRTVVVTCGSVSKEILITQEAGPVEQLAAPTNLKLYITDNGPFLPGTVCWDAVENADSYIITLYKNDNLLSQMDVPAESDNEQSGQMRTQFDQALVKESGFYYFTVQAKGSGRFEDSAVAESGINVYSGPTADVYEWPTVKPDTAENINTLRCELVEANASAVADSIVNDSESLAKFIELDNAYCAEGNYQVKVQVTPEAVQQGIAEGVTIDGAGLNAEGDAGGDVIFTVDAADAKTLPEGYGNAVFVDMQVSGITTNEDNTLKIPVYVTVPVPEQITQPENLIILHYDENGGYEEITPIMNQAENGQWTAAFALTHFSTFAFTEPVATEKITLSQTELTMVVGGEVRLNAIVASDMIASDLRWSSSDWSVASVTGVGEVTGNSIGTTVITAQLYGTDYSASCIVTVTEGTALATPTDLAWNVDENGNTAYGTISWDAVENCEGNYHVIFY